MLRKIIADRYSRMLNNNNYLEGKRVIFENDVLGKIEARLKTLPDIEHGFYLRGEFVAGHYVVHDVFLPAEAKIFTLNGDLAERTIFKIDSFIKHYKAAGQVALTVADICRELHEFKLINDKEYELLNKKYELGTILKDIEGVRWHNGISVHEPANDDKKMFTLYAHSHPGTTFNEKDIALDKKQGEGIVFRLNEDGKVEWKYYTGIDTSPTTKRTMAVANEKIIIEATYTVDNKKLLYLFPEEKTVNREIIEEKYFIKYRNEFLEIFEEETLETNILRIKRKITDEKIKEIMPKDTTKELMTILLRTESKRNIILQFLKKGETSKLTESQFNYIRNMNSDVENIIIKQELTSSYFDVVGLGKYLAEKYSEPITEIIKNFKFHIPILMPEKHKEQYIARFNGDLNIFKYLKDEVRYIERDPDNVFRIYFVDKEPITLVKVSDYRPTINHKDLKNSKNERIIIKPIENSLLTKELISMFYEDEKNSDIDKNIIQKFANSTEFIEYKDEELSRKIIKTDYYENADQFYDIFLSEQFKEKLIKLNILKTGEQSNYENYVKKHTEKIKEFYKLFIETENIFENIETSMGENILITLYKSGRDTVVSSDILDEPKDLSFFKDSSSEEIAKQLHLTKQDAEKVIKKILSLPDPMNYYQTSKNISGEMFLDLLQFIVKENNTISSEESTGFGNLLISNLIKLDREEFTKTTSAINKINELTSTLTGIEQERAKQKLLLLLLAIHDPHTLIEHSIDMANTFEDFLIFFKERYNEFRGDENTEELWASMQGIKEKLLLGVIFHDVGKLYIDQILLKKKGSTFKEQLIGKNRIEKEQVIIDQHIDHGRAIFEGIFEIYDEIILNCITRHHPPTKKEIEDYGKKKNDNPNASPPERNPYEQVVSFFDDLNAMLSERGYKNKISLTKIKEIKEKFIQKYKIINLYLEENYFENIKLS